VTDVLARGLNPRGLLLPIILAFAVPGIIWFVVIGDLVEALETPFILASEVIGVLLPALETVVSRVGITGGVGRALALDAVPFAAFSAAVFTILVRRGVPKLRAGCQAALWGLVLLQILGAVALGAMVFGSDEPDIRALKVYVDALGDIERIEVIYRPSREWIDEPRTRPEYEETVLIITDPTEIQQIVDGFRSASRFDPFWTQCGFYIKLNLYQANGPMHTLLVGFDDCKTFTAEHIHAVGRMANDYFYNEYVLQLRENR